MAKQQNTRGTSEYKNEKWASWTSTLGWPVQGIWPPGFDGSDINSCDRAIDHSVIVTGDDFGVVSLYEYPAASSNNAPHNKYYGHSSHVTSVQFTRWAPSEQPYLISTGGEDKCVF
jgi:echinoderm microtubule-associated protein-like 6